MTPFITSVGKPGWMVVRKSFFLAHKSKTKAMELLAESKKLWPHNAFVLLRVQAEEEFEAQTTLPDYEQTNAFGEELKSLRRSKERSFTIEMIPPDYDCDTGSVKVTISDGEFQGVGTSCELHGAIESARNAMEKARLDVQPVAIAVTEIKIEPPRPKISAAGLSIRKK